MSGHGTPCAWLTAQHKTCNILNSFIRTMTFLDSQRTTFGGLYMNYKIDYKVKKNKIFIFDFNNVSFIIISILKESYTYLF